MTTTALAPKDQITIEAPTATVEASAKDWLEALAFLAPGISRRPPAPYLKCVHVDPARGLLRTYDYETEAVTGIGFTGDLGPAFLAPYRWLVDAIRETTKRDKSQLVSLSVRHTPEGIVVTLEGGGYKLSSETAAVEEYPLRPMFKKISSAEVDTQELKASVAKVGVAASVDDTLPILTCIKVELEDDGLRLWATDRYRLATDAVPAEVDAKGQPSFLLRKRTLEALTKKLGTGQLTIWVSNDTVEFASPAGSYRTMAVDGDYPKIAGLFNDRDHGIIEVDRVGLLEAAKVAERMSERNTPVTLSANDHGVRATFDEGLFGASHSPRVPGRILAGGNVAVAFNPRYLMEALNSFSDRTVRISYLKVDKPWLVTGAPDEASKTKAHQHLLMPVRLPNTEWDQ